MTLPSTLPAALQRLPLPIIGAPLFISSHAGVKVYPHRREIVAAWRVRAGAGGRQGTRPCCGLNFITTVNW